MHRGTDIILDCACEGMCSGHYGFDDPALLNYGILTQEVLPCFFQYSGKFYWFSELTVRFSCKCSFSVFAEKFSCA